MPSLSRRSLVTAAAAAALAASAAGAQDASPVAAEEPAMSAPIVFFDLAGPREADLGSFYSAVFGWPVAPDGRFTARVVSPPTTGAALGGQIREDPADKRVYIGVPDVTAALADVAARGGVIEAPRFEVPGVVVLGLFRDPAGNSMGLVEMDGERVKIP